MAKSSPYSHSSYLKETDENLAEKSRVGDDLAFRVLMERYWKPIYNFSIQYVKKTEDADDIVQDTFLKVWKKIDQFQKGKKFRPWLFTIARNTALDLLKKKKVSMFTELDDIQNDLKFEETLEDPEPLPPEIFENASLVEDLKKAMNYLFPDHKAVLDLHYKENMTFDEIAEIMEKPMNTVKSWHRRALFKLRDMIAPKMNDKS